MSDRILERRAEIEALPVPPFPTEKYQVVLIDPPWKYDLRDKDASHRNRTPYPTLSNEEILSLPMLSILADPAYVMLWTTMNHLPIAFECLNQWGLKYRNIYTWVKVCKKQPPGCDLLKTRLGVGHWGRNSTEFILVATRGKARSLSGLGLTSIPTAISTHNGELEWEDFSAAMYAHRQSHSQKPQAIREVCNELALALGGVKKIELFAREVCEGWDCWGNEVK